MMMNLTHLRQRGFTLIEALVALLVLSIGLLGVAAMQLKSLQGAHAAYQRSIASLAAQDAQERLWAQLSANNASCPTTAEVDAIQNAWHAEWGGYLPGFSDESTVAERPECEFDIDVVWGEERFGESQESFSYSVRLPGNTP